MSMIGGAGFNKYAAGAKRYGVGLSGPNTGMKLEKAGYDERSMKQRAKNAAMLKWIQGTRAGGRPIKPQSQIGSK
jgi:hypothetical protein